VVMAMTVTVVVVTSAVAMEARRTTTTLINATTCSVSCVGRKGMLSRSASSGLIAPGEEKVVALATTSYGRDMNWYEDFGATAHITSDLDKLSMQDKFGGNDQVHMASISGMKIQHVGTTNLHTPSHDLILKNILHVPAVNENLISIDHFSFDNQAFFELHLCHFFIKDGESRKVLHHNRVENCLYPLMFLAGKQVPSSVKVSFDRWHYRVCLGTIIF
jgi:hypothetical protein